MSRSDSRQLLVDAGLKSILASGYGATGLTEILELAKVPKGSFYHHFPSKEAFAQEVIRQYAMGQTEKIKELLFDTKRTPVKRLRRYFRQMISDHGCGTDASGCLFGTLSLEVATRSEPLRVALRDAFDSWQSALKTTLSEAIAAKEISSTMKVDDLAALVISLWEGAHVRAKVEQSDKPLELFYRFTFEKLLVA